MRWIAVNALYLIRWVWDYDLNRVELALGAAACLAAVAGLRFHALQKALSTLARRRRVAILTTGVAALGLRAALLPVEPIPQPVITDEFSHLLLADTLAAGRVANPPHPMWRHFETIHVIQKPTYASMYFPAQGFLLAIGQAVMGQPWWGVWLSGGLLCAALCWMLQQWLPPGWALLGGAVAVLRFGLFSYWVDSYWGGAVPALGGALVLGAMPGIIKRRSIGAGLTLAAGATILLYSRPFEGFALCATAALICRRQWLTRVGLACAVAMCLSGAALGYYCYRVTGSPVRLPYQVNQKSYGWPMTMLWYHPHPVDTPHKELRDYYNWELSEHTKFLPDALVQKFQFLWGFFIGPCLTIPLLFLPWIVRDRRIRPLLIAMGAVLAAVLIEQTGYPHYLSPATGAILTIVLQGMRHMRTAKFGRTLVPLLPAVLVLTLAVRVVGIPYATLARYLSWCCNEAAPPDRAEWQARLEGMPGKQLAIVRYAPNHSFAQEWVYNRASIDAAKVVWARDMGPENAELERYFADRKVWMIDAP
jgi:hypothetical protein